MRAVSEGGSNSFSLSEQLFLPLPIKYPGSATKAWDSGVSSVSTVMVARKLSPYGPFMTPVFSLRQPSSAPLPQTSIIHFKTVCLLLIQPRYYNPDIMDCISSHLGDSSGTANEGFWFQPGWNEMSWDALSLEDAEQAHSLLLSGK